MVVQHQVPYFSVGSDISDSDADFVVVVRNPHFTRSGYFYLEGEGMDVSIFFEEFWEALLLDNVVWAVACLFVPEEFELLRKREWHFTLDKARISRVALADAKHNIAKVETLLLLFFRKFGLLSS
jgi:hypothetical protein